MARKKATTNMNPSTPNEDITATADAHSDFDVETIGETDRDAFSSADLAAEKMTEPDPALQSVTMEQNQEQMGSGPSDFNPVGSSSVGSDMPDTSAPASAKLPSASEVADTVKVKASDAASQAKQAAGAATEQVKAQATEVIGQTKQAATDALGKAKDSVVSQLDGQIDRASSSLGDLTEALRQTGEQFKSQNIPFVPDYAEQFAGQLDRVSDYLKQNDVNKLAADAEAFARKNPALFIGGAFLLGIGIARFIKASGANTELFDAPGSSRAGMGSLSSGMDASNMDNLPAVASEVAPMGGDMSIPTERQDINTDDAVPSGKVMSAHGYVPGGVAGGSPN